jgi:NADH dehydrogenase FAD-containing subunit
MPQPKPQVVILGAGFGGLEAAKTFRREPVEITLIAPHCLVTKACSREVIIQPNRSTVRPTHRTLLALEVVALISPQE